VGDFVTGVEDEKNVELDATKNETVERVYNSSSEHSESSKIESNETSVSFEKPDCQIDIELKHVSTSSIKEPEPYIEGQTSEEIVLKPIDDPQQIPNTGEDSEENQRPEETSVDLVEKPVDNILNICDDSKQIQNAVQSQTFEENLTTEEIIDASVKEPETGIDNDDSQQTPNSCLETSEEVFSQQPSEKVKELFSASAKLLQLKKPNKGLECGKVVTGVFEILTGTFTKSLVDVQNTSMFVWGHNLGKANLALNLKYGDECTLNYIVAKDTTGDLTHPVVKSLWFGSQQSNTDQPVETSDFKIWLANRNLREKDFLKWIRNQVPPTPYFPFLSDIYRCRVLGYVRDEENFSVRGVFLEICDLFFHCDASSNCGNNKIPGIQLNNTNIEAPQSEQIVSPVDENEFSAPDFDDDSKSRDNMIPGMENYEEGNKADTPAIGSNKFAVLFKEDFYICGVRVCNSDLRLLLKPGDLICCQCQPIDNEDKEELAKLSRIPNIEASITQEAYLGYVGSERPKQANLAPCYAPEIDKYLETKGISFTEFEIMRYPDQDKAMHSLVPSPYGALPGISGPYTDQVSDIQIASNIAARAVSVTSLEVENAESFLHNPKEVEIANIVVKVLSQTVNVHLQDTVTQSSSSSRRQKKDRSGSRTISTSNSRRRTPSPVNRSRFQSRSFRRTRSRSPRRSPSPKRRSPSPKRRRRSPSPKRRRSPSPKRRRSPSPKRRRSPSPKRRRSPSPRRARRSPSPRRKRRSPSPKSSSSSSFPTKDYSPQGNVKQYSEAPPRAPPFLLSSGLYNFNGTPSLPCETSYHLNSNMHKQDWAGGNLKTEEEEKKKLLLDEARLKRDYYERILQRETELKNIEWSRQELQEREAAKERIRMLELEREQIRLREHELEKIRKIAEERVERVRREVSDIWERREDRTGSQEMNRFSSNMFDKDQSAFVGISLPPPVASRSRGLESNIASGASFGQRELPISYIQSYNNQRAGTKNEPLWANLDPIDTSSKWNTANLRQDRTQHQQFGPGASAWVPQHLDYSSGNRFMPNNDATKEPARNNPEKFPSPKPMRLNDSPP